MPHRYEIRVHPSILLSHPYPYNSLDSLKPLYYNQATMTRDNGTPTKKGKRSGKKKTLTGSARLETLTKIAHENVEKYTKVVNTDKAYDGHIDRGIRFLRREVAERRANGVAICEDGMSTDELEKAFDNPPNEYSAMIIEMFITEKCFNKNFGRAVAEGIHAAFCRYWDTMSVIISIAKKNLGANNAKKKKRDGEKFAGAYSYNPVMKEVSGCPARAPGVLAVKKAVLTRSKADSASRKHAEAITIEDMITLMRWSEQMCSNKQLEALLRHVDGIEQKPMTVDELRHIFEHGFMRAFASSAFTLWTR
jgi:hypothetical protein